MPTPTVSIGFSPTTPAPDAGYVNAVPRGDGGTPLLRESFQVPNVGGVSVKTGNYTAVAADNGALLSFEDSSPVTPHTLTLPSSPPFAKWKIAVQNIGSGTLTISRNGLLIDTAAANLTLNQNSGVEIFTDGTNYFTERGAASLPSGAANLVLATPNGSSGTASLRALVAADLPTTVQVGTAGITIDGGGSTPTTGSKGFLQIPFAGTITSWTVIGDVSGSASFTVKKSTFAAFPTNSSIVASAKPTLSSQQNATSATLTGWTTAITAGDVLEFVLDSATTVTRLVLELQITKS